MSGSPALFTPFAVRAATFRNRIVLSPMCQYMAMDGFVGAWHLAHHARFALGGVGGAIVEASGVTRNGRITPGCLGAYLDAHVEGLSRIVELYRAQSIPIGIQLSHSGRKGSFASPRDGAAPLVDADAWQTVGPSAVPLAEGRPAPRALDEAGIAEMVKAFASAAGRAVQAGFDFVEIHGAHGYLIHSFMSPLSNRRTDRWGGDVAGRMRFPTAVAKAVREIIPDDMPLFYRTSAVDGVEGGLQLDDTIALAQALKVVGVDVIDCSSGGITGASGRAHATPAPGYLVGYAEAVRQGADVLAMAVGLIVDPAQAEAIVAGGRADLVAMGRQLLVEPAFAYRAACELGLEDPCAVLPENYAFYLRRRPPLPGAAR